MRATCLFILLAVLLISARVYSQEKVGIGVLAPTEALSVNKGMNVDHDNENAGTNLLNGLKFGNSAISAQLVGISSNRAGASPYSLDFYTSNSRRMIIMQNGLVGINAVPTSYFLEVGGTIKGFTLRSAGSVLAEGGSVTAASSVSAGTSINAVDDITSSNGDIIASNGNLIAGGKGVMMSNSASRQRVVAYTATLSVSSLAAGSSVTGSISISSGTFTGTPTAYVGNVVTENGEYYKAMIVLENVTTSGIIVRVVNVTSSAISFSGAQWKILVIGAY